MRGGGEELLTDFRFLGSHQLLHSVESGGIGEGRVRVGYHCTICGPGGQI